MINMSGHEHAKQFESLFQTLADGLRRLGVSELNERVSQAINRRNLKQQTKSKKIDIVLIAVAKDFGISKDALIFGTNNVSSNARKHAYVLLHVDDELKLPLRYIAKHVFMKDWHTSVSNAVQRYKDLQPEKIKDDKLFIDRLRRIQQAIEKA